MDSFKEYLEANGPGSWGGDSFRITDINGAPFPFDPEPQLETFIQYRPSWEGETRYNEIQIPAGSKIAYIAYPIGKITCLRPTTWYSYPGVLQSNNGEALVHNMENCGGNSSSLIPMRAFDKELELAQSGWDQEYKDSFDDDYSDCDFVLTFGCTG